jgi:hypothetical protein
MSSAITKSARVTEFRFFNDISELYYNEKGHPLVVRIRLFSRRFTERPASGAWMRLPLIYR